MWWVNWGAWTNTETRVVACGCVLWRRAEVKSGTVVPLKSRSNYTLSPNCWHAWAGGPTPNFGSGVRGVASRMYEANTSFDAHIITSFAHDFLQPHEKWLESIRGRMVKVGVVFPAAKGTSRVQRNIVARERALARAR